MPKHTPVLFDEGDNVMISGGPHSGAKGTVIGHRRVHSDSPDTLHVVKFNEPKQTTAERTVDMGGGKKYTESEPVTLDYAEVPSSQLTED